MALSFFTKYSTIVLSATFLFLFYNIVTIYFANDYAFIYSKYNYELAKLSADLLPRCLLDSVSITTNLGECDLLPYVHVYRSFKNGSLFLPFSVYDPWNSKTTSRTMALSIKYSSIDKLALYLSTACDYNLTFNGYLYIDEPLYLHGNEICNEDNVCYFFRCQVVSNELPVGFYRVRILNNNKLEVIA